MRTISDKGFRRHAVVLLALALAVPLLNGCSQLGIAKTDDLTVSPKPDALVLFNPVFDLVPFMEQLKMDPKEWTDKAKQISPNWNIKAGFPAGDEISASNVR